MADVAITGLGLVTAVGRGLEATEAALRAGRSGLGALTLFPSPRLGHHPVAQVEGVPAGPRNLALARLAVGDALNQAQLRAAPERVALVVGTCGGGMPESEAAQGQLIAGEPFDQGAWARHGCVHTTARLADEHGLAGPMTTVSNACSSGAEALALGAELLETGLADAVVAGGVDAITRLTLNGFAALLAMDPEGARPFDVQRAGMSLGEGAAFCVLERGSEARARGARIHARLAGYANTCDAHHATAPDPEGRGATAAMRGALALAGLEPGAIDYVSAHGTGTPGNDLAEGGAIARLFGAQGGGIPPTASVKGLFGHTLGAAGAIEAVVCALALSRGFLPGTARLTDPDPACVIEPLRETRDGAPRAILSNSFGFGGNNTALVLRHAEDGA